MIYTKYNTPQKLFERFERVNKVKLNESVFDTDTLDSKLTEYYNLLKQNQLNVDSINTSVSGDESFVELVCTDDAGNQITFNFKSRFDEGDQDGVFNLVEGEMITFAFSSNDGTTNIEIDENGLNTFNERFRNELVDIISDFVDVENNQPEEALYNEAVKKIDQRTFKPLSLNENDEYKTANINVGDGKSISFKDLPETYKQKYFEFAEETFRRFLASKHIDINAYPKSEFDRKVNELAEDLFVRHSQGMNEDYPDPIAKTFSSKKSDPFKEKRSSKKTMVINELNTDTVPGYANIDLPQDDFEYDPINVGDEDMENKLLGNKQIRENLSDSLSIDKDVLVDLIVGISELDGVFQNNLFKKIGGVSTHATFDEIKEKINKLSDSDLEIIIITFADRFTKEINENMNMNSGEHCVIFDGTSAYIGPSSDAEDEIAMGNEVLGYFDDIDAAQDYADEVNREAYQGYIK